MKMLQIALALLVPANGASLGIGIDVLPEAFGFAARRVGFTADLRLTTCDASRCRWDLGGGVEVAANTIEGSLYIDRIEVTLDRASAAVASSSRRYENACLAIVALVQRGASLRDLRVTAQAIATPAGGAARAIQIDTSDRTISLYSGPPSKRDETRPIAKTCGAAAV